MTTYYTSLPTCYATGNHVQAIVAVMLLRLDGRSFKKSQTDTAVPTGDVPGPDLCSSLVPLRFPPEA
ncbi:MAG TPA: hypothetical protein VEI57_11280 [Nitrospirota bacterium]|nr:hypothetical protein [Nitrospirota bacterium]